MQDKIIEVTENRLIAKDCYQMRVKMEYSGEIRGGQFIHIKLPNAYLRRPFCIADFKEGEMTLYYQIVGEGTKQLSQVAVGEQLKALFPLGNGFFLDDYKKIAIVAGGIGTAVFPAVISAYPDKEYYTFFGFSDKERVILENEMRERSEEFYLSTDNGSAGEKGFVTDRLAKEIERIRPDVVIACGPKVMFRSLKKTMDGRGIPTLVSMEERMGCGIGACLVCTCKVKKEDGEHQYRVCKDGPVFDLNEVVL